MNSKRFSASFPASWFFRFFPHAERIESCGGFLRSWFPDGDKARALGEDELPDVSTGGLKAVALFGDFDPSRLPKASPDITVVKQKGKKVTAQCGHIARTEVHYNLYGVLTKGDGARHCPECGIKELERITIRCALCELPILPGDAVSIYDSDGQSLKLEHAYRLDE